jgi:hypothetical protein
VDKSKDSKRLVKAKGPVQYDLAGMHDGDFDLLCFRLIRLHHPDAVKPKESGDGGADVLLPHGGGGYSRAWQAKHYPGRINWTACKKSLADAVKNYGPERYTFCFPRDLSGTEQKTFDKHFRAPGAAIPVDFWNGTEIQSRLTESHDGRTVADHFFKDDADQLEEIKLAALAKGDLSTVGDALDRMNPIGNFLARKDPYYHYPAAIYEAGGKSKTPVADGTIMSIEQPHDGVIARIDVVPKDEEALDLFAPKGRMTLPREAYERLQEAVSRGEPVTAEGVELTFEQLPPALSDDVGKPMVGSISFVPDQGPPPTPWDAKFVAERGSLKERFDVMLEPVAPPEGWDGCLEGSFGDLVVRFLFRRHDDGGQLGATYTYRLGTSPANEQLRALRFMDLVAGDGGTLRIVDKRHPERDFTLDTGAPDDTADTSALVAFFESIVEIEEWAGQGLPIRPDLFTDANFRQVGAIAGAIRRGGFKSHFKQAELSLPPENLETVQSGKELVLEQDFSGKVLGREIELGRSRAVITDYDVERQGADSNGNERVRLVPKSEAGAEVFQTIIRPVKARKPPPPPRRKKRRGRGKRKGGRSR